MSFFWFLFVVITLGGLFSLWRSNQNLKDEVVRLRYLQQSIPDLREDMQAGLRITRQHLVQILEKDPPSAEAILEGLPFTDLTPEEARDLVKSTKNLVVLDVRTPQEYQAGHLPDALNVPINSLEGSLDQLPDKTAPLLLYCASGARSLAGCEFLSQKGYTRIYHLPTGYASYPQ